MHVIMIDVKNGKSGYAPMQKLNFTERKQYGRKTNAPLSKHDVFSKKIVPSKIFSQAENILIEIICNYK